jgi:hypothetical protein
MQQGSSAGLATRTAGMTDEQILDLKLNRFNLERWGWSPGPSRF